MSKLIKDSQSRITRYGMQCDQIIDGVKCLAFARATKKGNSLIINENYKDFFDIDGKSVSGVYKIISTGTGKISEVICEKIN